MPTNITYCAFFRQAENHNAYRDNWGDSRHIIAMSDKPAQYFAKWRKHRELTQAQAAELTGLQQGLLSALERGARRYNEDHLAAMASAYVCETWQLLGQDPEDGDAGTIVSIWDHIPSRNREQAKQILQTFTEKKA